MNLNLLLIAQQPKWTLPGRLWNMSVATPTTATLPGYNATSTTPYVNANGAYDAAGNLLFSAVVANWNQITIKSSTGATIGDLRPYFASGYASPPGSPQSTLYYNDYINAGSEVAIVPVPNSCKRFYVIYTMGSGYIVSANCVLYAIVDCSTASTTISYPNANSAFSNAPINGGAAPFPNGYWSSHNNGLAVSKKLPNGERYLFTGGITGVLRFTITGSGIGNQTLISSDVDEPTLFGVFNGSGQPSDEEIDLSPDQKWLSVLNNKSGKLILINLNTSYNKVNGATKAASIASMRGAEFNLASNRIYVSTATDAKYIDFLSSMSIGNVTQGLNIKNSFLERAHNGKIYGINAANRFYSINETAIPSTTLGSTTLVYSNENTYTDWAVGATLRFHLPDQIDGENFTEGLGDVAAVPQFTVNGNVNMSSVCASATQLYNCNLASFNLTDYSTNAITYQLKIYPVNASCVVNLTPIMTTVVSNSLPATLANLTLTAGASVPSNYLTYALGKFQIELLVTNACGKTTSIKRFFNLSTGPTGATSEFPITAQTKPGQTYTISGCTIPQNQAFTYHAGASSCGGVGGYKFPNVSSVASPLAVGRLFTSLDLTGVSAGVGSLNYSIRLKVDRWDGSNWQSMDSNPNGETLSGTSIIPLVGLLGYDINNPWYEAFTNAALTPNGSIYRISVDIINECGTISTSRIIQMNNVELRNASFSGEENENDLTFEIVPNPTREVINVFLNEEIEGDIEIQLLDMNGRVLQSMQTENTIKNQKNSFDLVNVSSGSYFIQVKSAAGIQTQKVFIE